MDKVGYFQGTEEPTPKKKKYKSEKAVVVQPRFKEPFYHNYDLYDTEGVDGKAKQGPGAGFYQNMDKYKSVSDFLHKNRKRNEDKYKADDLWIEDDGSLSKEEKKKKISRRLALLSIITKYAIDFPIDDQINSTPISEENSIYQDSAQIGGYLDRYQPFDDFEGKSPDQLDFGRDYDDEQEADPDLEFLENKYLNPSEPSLFGLLDGILPKEDLDPSATISPNSQQYGTTDSGNTLYDNMWFL